MLSVLLAAHVYVVQPGDTLSSRFGAGWRAVCAVNHLPDCNLIYPGQRLVVTTAGGTVQTSAWSDDDHDGDAGESAGAPAVAYTAPSYGGSYSGAPGSFQACVIARESGGNASAVNPYSGAGGLYGFLPSTWHALGYSGLPENASVATQNAAFAQEYAQAGAAPWAAYDGC